MNGCRFIIFQNGISYMFNTRLGYTKVQNEHKSREILFMEDKTNLRLTAAEISTLWTQYINDSLSVCANEYFLNHAEDQDCLKAIQLPSIHRKII